MARIMKDSGIEWIGGIPREWDLVQIKFLKSNVKNAFVDGPFGSNLKSIHFVENGDAYVVESGFITTGKFVFKKFKTITAEHFETIKRSECKGKDIIIAKIGANFGMAAELPLLDKPAVVSGNSLKITLNENKILNSIFVYELGIAKNLGGYVGLYNETAQPALSLSSLNAFRLVVPPLPEQQKIADFLDTKCSEIDAVVKKTEETIEEYKKLKQSVITEAVTKGVRGERPMKDSGIEWIGEIPQEWDVKVAFQLFNQVKNKNEGLIETNLLSLSYGKIKRKSIDTIGGLLPESFDGYNIIEKNDIVLRLTDLQNDHTSLRVGLATERGIVTSAYLTLRNYSENLPEYLYYFLHSYDIYKGFYGMGAGVRQGLNWDGLKLLKIALPPVDEQEEIISYIAERTPQIESLIESKQKLLEELQAYKKSVIYEYVTGKKEVV